MWISILVMISKVFAYNHHKILFFGPGPILAFLKLKTLTNSGEGDIKFLDKYI
jgi:hypothetical protein